MKRAEEYLAASPKRLSTQMPEDVETYLRQAGRKEGLKDWQFRQIADAIQNLLEHAGVGWLGRVDWEFWRDSARKLDNQRVTNHRTLGFAALSPTYAKSCTPGLARMEREPNPGTASTSAAKSSGCGRNLDSANAPSRLRGYAATRLRDTGRSTG